MRISLGPLLNGIVRARRANHAGPANNRGRRCVKRVYESLADRGNIDERPRTREEREREKWGEWKILSARI